MSLNSYKYIALLLSVSIMILGLLHVLQKLLKANYLNEKSFPISIL